MCGLLFEGWEYNVLFSMLLEYSMGRLFTLDLCHRSSLFIFQETHLLPTFLKIPSHPLLLSTLFFLITYSLGEVLFASLVGTLRHGDQTGYLSTFELGVFMASCQDGYHNVVASLGRFLVL